jgi:L-lactate dehydrogenase complex protein LldF
MTPALIGVEAGGNLPNASTFCGRCESVCPMKIPLPKLMRNWREEEFRKGLTPPGYRRGLATWAWFARRPRLYHFLARFGVAIVGALGRGRGRFSWLPFASGWTRDRDLPSPQGRTFQQLWAESQKGVPR